MCGENDFVDCDESAIFVILSFGRNWWKKVSIFFQKIWWGLKLVLPLQPLREGVIQKRVKTLEKRSSENV